MPENSNRKPNSEQVEQITVSEAGKRADVVIADHFTKYSRSALHRLFENKLVTIDDEPIKASYKVSANDVLSVDISQFNAVPAAVSIPILYENDEVIVVDKPLGMLTHSKGALNEEATVASFIRPKIASSLEGNRAGIVHRLDRATSGVLIAAKTPESLQWLQKQFSQRRTKKTYLAIVSGEVDPLEAIIDVPIERNPRNQKTFRAGAQGKSAQTTYRVLQQTFQYALVELKPYTGRTHQLRVHLQYIHHPIVGDVMYGGEPAERLYLHAKELEITLPNKQRAVFTSQVPVEFSDLMKPA